MFDMFILLYCTESDILFSNRKKKKWLLSPKRIWHKLLVVDSRDYQKWISSYERDRSYFVYRIEYLVFGGTQKFLN